MAVRVYNQSRSSTPAAISIPDGSLATKLKTSQQVSVICCESWVLWRKHLKRSAGDGCLLFLLKSISRLTLPLLPWWMRVCVCVQVTKQHKHTPTHRQMETHAATEKKKKSVSHPCRACAHRAASVRGAGGRWGVEGGGGWRGGSLSRCGWQMSPFLLSSSSEQVIDQFWGLLRRTVALRGTETRARGQI